MDTRRGEFRRWLDYDGVLDAFTKRTVLFLTNSLCNYVRRRKMAR